MMTRIANAIFVAAAMTTGTQALGADWTLDPATSVVSFGSIKNDYIGEAHTFSGLTGSVGSDGTVGVVIDLATVNTNIDIRNERMGEHVFAGAATAELAATVDMAALEGLAVGESQTMEVDGTLKFLGEATDLYIDMFVMRVSEDRVMASTNTALYVATEDLGIDAGIDVLQELAGLDSITRVTPVTLRLMFSK